MFLRLSRPNSAIVFFSMFYLTLFLSPANKVWGKVIFSVACVKNSVHRGICLSTCWDTIPPRTRHPPSGADTLLEQAPPGAGTSWDQVPLPPESRHPPPGTRHTPQEQTPLGADPACAVHAGRYGQQAGDMHPTGMQSCYNFHWIFLIWWYKFEEFLCNFSIFTEIKRLIFEN